MGTTVVVFDDPGVEFDNPLAGFDNPLAGHEKVEGDMGVATDSPENVLHAMLTWAATEVVRDGKRRKIHLFGVGRGADLALKVGANRTDDLRSILVDSPTFESASAVDKLPIGDTENNLEAFVGVRVVRTSSKKLGKLDGGSVSLAPDSMTYPKAATLQDLATSGKYQRAVAEVVTGPSATR